MDGCRVEIRDVVKPIYLYNSLSRMYLPNLNVGNTVNGCVILQQQTPDLIT